MVKKIEGTINFRDLGGIKNTDGRVVREGILYRSDALHKLTDADLKRLKNNYRVSLVIDLRTSQELEDKPDRIIEGAGYEHVPLFTEAQAGITREEGGGVLYSLLDMSYLYRLLVEDEGSSSRIGKALRLILHNNDGASVFHCTAGKDRTGVLSMLILGLLGISEENILDDYLKTNLTGEAVADKVVKEIIDQTHDEELARKVHDSYIADEKFLRAAIDYIRDEYGTVENYCKSKLKISSDEIEAFREKMLVQS